MSDRTDHDPEWDLEEVNHATRDLVEALALGRWPEALTTMAFDLASDEQYEAIQMALESREVTPAALDDAMRDGPKLTALIRAAPSNPYKDITFESDREWMQAGLRPKPVPMPHEWGKYRPRDVDSER